MVPEKRMSAEIVTRSILIALLSILIAGKLMMD